MPRAKIGFILLSNSKRPIPSTRIAILNIIPHLRAAGFDTQIAYEPEQGIETPKLSHLMPALISAGYDILVFQKVHGQDVEQAVELASNAGIRTLFIVCDLVDPAMAHMTDATAVVTDYLRSLYPTDLHPKIHVVHDGIERPELHKSQYSDNRGSATRALRAILVTSADLDRLPVLESPPNWLNVDIVGRYPPIQDKRARFREDRWQFARLTGIGEKLAFLRFLTNRRIRRLPWSPAEVYEQMLLADIGIIPIDTNPPHIPGHAAPSWKVKSENRLTMMMALGLPVVATPIPSYEPVIQHGVNGFLARTRREFLECLETLRDPVVRREVGKQARLSVLPRYSIEEQARKLIDVLASLA